MHFYKTLKITLPILLFAVLSACATNPSSAVKSADKDSGIFNGKWRAAMQKSAATQFAGAWQLSCNMGTSTFPLEVNDGVISLFLDAKPEKTYINSNGQFRFDIPLAEKSSESARSDVALTQGDTTLVLVGSLKKLKGRITFAVQEFGGAGCTSTVKYSKVGESV